MLEKQLERSTKQAAHRLECETGLTSALSFLLKKQTIFFNFFYYDIQYIRCRYGGKKKTEVFKI